MPEEDIFKILLEQNGDAKETELSPVSCLPLPFRYIDIKELERLDIRKLERNDEKRSSHPSV